MKSNSRQNILGQVQNTTVKYEQLSLGKNSTASKKHYYKISSPRAQRRRVQKKELYSPEPFTEGRSEFWIRGYRRICSTRYKRRRV